MLNQAHKIALFLGASSFIYFHWCLIHLDAFLTDKHTVKPSGMTPEQYYRRQRDSKRSKKSPSKVRRLKPAIGESSLAAYSSESSLSTHTSESSTVQDGFYEQPIRVYSDEHIGGHFNVTEPTYLSDNETLVNPATSEMMVGGMAGVDTSGNSFGSDISDMSSCFDDMSYSSDSDSGFNA